MNKALRLLVAALLASPLTLHAQNELSNFSATGRGGVINTFATDYQAIGINPANLGRKTDHKAAVTIAETGIGYSSQSLTKSQLNQLIFHADDALPASERPNLVNALTGANTFNANVDITTIGFSIKLPEGFGAIAVSNRYRSGVHVGLNHNAADIIVNGSGAAIYTSGAYINQNVSTSLDGTNIQGAVTSEYNIAYGVGVLDLPGIKVTAGLGYRYIQGIGIVDIRIQDGSFYGYNALSPVFKINYGSVVNNANFNNTTGSGLKSVGHGNGVDLGLAAEVGKTIRLGVSVTDIGSMTWNGNVLSANDQHLQTTSDTPLTTYNIFKELSNQLGSDGKTLFTYQPNQTHNGGLPTKLRTGAGMRISELFEAGLDVTVPLNKVASNLSSTFMGLGLDYKPISWIRLSTGFTAGAGYGKSLPLGITFVTKNWDAGISTRDVVGLFSESSPYNSVAFGLLRFKIN